MVAFEQALPALPVLYLALSGFIFAISLHMPKQGQRLALLPLILMPAYLSLSAVRYVWLAPGISLVWEQALTGYALHIISTLHLEKVPPPSSATPVSATLRSNTRFDFIYFRQFWLNPRLIIHLQPTQHHQENRRSSRTWYSLFCEAQNCSYTTLCKQRSPLYSLTRY